MGRGGRVWGTVVEWYSVRRGGLGGRVWGAVV